MSVCLLCNKTGNLDSCGFCKETYCDDHMDFFECKQRRYLCPNCVYQGVFHKNCERCNSMYCDNSCEYVVCANCKKEMRLDYDNDYIPNSCEACEEWWCNDCFEMGFYVEDIGSYCSECVGLKQANKEICRLKNIIKRDTISVYMDGILFDKNIVEIVISY
jgi:hypothetical protein